MVCTTQSEANSGGIQALIKSHKRAKGETYLKNFAYFYNVKNSFKLQFSNAEEKKYDEESRCLGNKS